jgi:DNA-binding NarL/FixJ family response regulator
MGSRGTVAQLRIAIFDDNPDVRDALERRLAKDPRVMAVASAAISGIDSMARVIAQLGPTVVLIDPGRGGMDAPALRTLLNLRRDAAFVIALHVAHANEVERRWASAAGCDLHVLKGLRTGALVDLLADAVEQAGEGEAHSRVHGSHGTLDELGD